MKTRRDVFGALNVVSDMMQGILGGEEQGFWHVISALRGPDLESCAHYKLSETENILTEKLKEATTAVIRFNLGMSRDNSGGCTVNADTEKFAIIRRQLDRGQHNLPWHFISHSKRAFEALGLKWDEVNPDLEGEISYKV